jgi:hypothetical protein
MSTIAAKELKEKFGFESIFETNLTTGRIKARELSFGKLIDKLKRYRGGTFHYSFGDFIYGGKKYTHTNGDDYYGIVHGNVKDGRVNLLGVSHRIELDYGNKFYKSIDYPLKYNNDYTNIERVVFTIQIPFVDPISDAYEDKYALIIHFFEYEHFRFVYHDLLGYSLDWPKADTIALYDDVLSNGRGISVEELLWVYRTAPDFVLRRRDDDDLIQDIKDFVSYDIDTFFFSWFRDASSPIIRALLSFSDLKSAYDHFKDYPEDAIRTYSGLSDFQRQIFTTILSMLSRRYKHTKKDSKFFIGKEYKLDSNLGQESGDTFYLRQLKKTPDTLVSTPVGFTKSPGLDVEISKEFFHPLDRVTLVDTITGEEQIVTAIEVKRLSDAAEWEAVMDAVTVVFSVIAILVSVGTLAAGASGIVALLAVSEIVIGGIDIFVVLARSKLEKTEGGKWFIENWDRLNLAIGLLSIGGALRRGILKYGPKLLLGLKKVAIRGGKQLKKFIEQLLTSLQVEFYFAYRNQVLLGTLGFTIKDLADVVGRRFANKMARFGVSVFKPLDNESKIFGIIYDGEKILEGTKAQIKAALKDVFPHGVDDLDIIKNLDKILDEVNTINTLKKNKDFLKYFDELNSGLVSRVFPKLLSVGEEAVLRFYTTNLGYKNFNKALRGEIPMSDFYLAQEKLMNQALDKLPKYDSTSSLLYRIENLSDNQIKLIYKKGEIITNKHFTSATYDPEAIAEAMRYRKYTVLVRIEGKNGKLIENLSTFNKEKEVIFMSKTRFEVVDIRLSTSPEDYLTPIKTIILKEL